MKWVPLPAILILVGLLACHADSVSLKPLDLHPYGIPMTIQAPDSTVVTEKDYKFMRDITLRKALNSISSFLSLQLPLKMPPAKNFTNWNPFDRILISAR
jgi:hypothetical protein